MYLIFRVVFIACSGVISSAAKLDLRSLVAKNDMAELAEAMKHPEIERQINKRDKRSGQTPLMSAVLGGKSHSVEALLSAGADISIPENDGYTPMHGAGFQGRADIVPILADRSVPLIDFHKDGYAPLHRACWGKENRHTETVAAFIKAGVPHDLKSKDGRTCFHMTTNPKTLALLKDLADRSVADKTDAVCSTTNGEAAGDRETCSVRH